MGQEEYELSDNNHLEKISRNFFDFQYVIGKGGFGKVNIEIFIYIIFRFGKLVSKEQEKFMQLKKCPKQK